MLTDKQIVYSMENAVSTGVGLGDLGGWIDFWDAGDVFGDTWSFVDANSILRDYWTELVQTEELD